MFSKLKFYAAALLAFFLALFTAKYYRTKAKRLQRQVVQEKAKIHNYQSQIKAAHRKQAAYQREIEDATKDDSYLDYFDDD